MYYRLGYRYPKDENDGYYMVEDGVDFDGVRSWALGQPFEKPPPEPIRLDLVPINDFTGVPPDMFDGYMCLMSKSMVDTVKSMGVDNIETYRAILDDKPNGREFEYFAVNILGVVAAANLGESEWENLDGPALLDTHFDKLVVDPKKARGQFMFRLAEDTGTIVVHERVKQALEAKGLATLTFKKVG
jgi:hypothetical protein